MKNEKYKKPKVGRIPTDFQQMIRNSTGGGCPYVFVWNGNKYLKENNILPQSENWLRNEKIVEDYYVLQNRPVLESGKIKLKLKEFEKEISYLNKIELLTIEHKRNTTIGISNDGEILNYSLTSVHPISIKDSDGKDYTKKANNPNWFVSKNYYSAIPGDSLELAFKKPKSDNLKLIIVDPKEDNWLDIHIKDYLSRKVKYRSIRVYIYLSDTVKCIDIVPARMEFYPDIVDLTRYLSQVKDTLKIKLEFIGHYKIAFIGLDNTPVVFMAQKVYKLNRAIHSKLKNVTNILQEKNNQFVHIMPGEEIELDFSNLDLPEAGNKMSYILKVSGYYIPITKLMTLSKETVNS